jgi:head-tail adaptor
MKSVCVGRMDTQVEILSVAETLSATGAPTYSETLVDTVWGEYEESARGETVVGAQPKAAIAATVKIWPYPGLTAKHRVRINGVTLDIDSIHDTDNRRRKLLQLRAKL